MRLIKSKLPTKKTIICKQVKNGFLRKDIRDTHKPKAGDVALFKVQSIGKHTRVQVTSGNNAFILPGDHIMAAFGNRYASEQFEGYIPKQPVREYHILGQGGAIGVVASQHQRFELIGPTRLSMVGYMTDDNGRVLNTKQLHKNELSRAPLGQVAPVILSLGTGMDSGKTTTAGFLIHGLRKAGKKAVYVKLTGTVYARDKRFALDYGAALALDFADLGFPSTYMCSPAELRTLYRTLLAKAMQVQPDYIVVEIADGLLQRETKMLLNDKELAARVKGALLSSGDSLGALYGTRYLQDLGYRVLGLSGLLTVSPLLTKEVIANCKKAVLTAEELADKKIIARLKL